ncbi:hypothetical protein LPJ64_006410 [Coemansia asiatica]|uniref:NADP-dependent oxidoreductase domain-containing protein n=1 Tax=Coemansia asiatica TaxID=1052880 RepID=A0A9W7XEL1_9FUNG|nr:hypothetical protein LPJ64_006410 [Coemansia asiatica]
MSLIPTIEFGVPDDKVTVPRIGLGAMPLTGGHGSFDIAESTAILNRAVDIGCTFWDTADVYGLGANEKLLGSVLKQRGENVFVGTKFGLLLKNPGPDFDDSPSKLFQGFCGTPEYMRKQVETSLESLGVDRIDIYYLHRVDRSIPIEVTVGAMAELVKEGKVRYLGLSECTADELRRAYKVHPIAAVQSEYSLCTTDIERNGVLDACRELGVTFVAYSPLGRGFLAGNIRKNEDLEKTDTRRGNSRFQKENIDNNLKLVEGLDALAKKHGKSKVQMTLAWLLAQEPNLIVIPGTRCVKYLDENFATGNITLTDEEIRDIRQLIDSVDIKGDR